MLVIYALVCILVIASTLTVAADNDAVRQKSIGFGVDRLKLESRKKQLLKQSHATADCGNSKEYYYSDAVIDNFAPIQSQQKWKGLGQRYWINDELFGKAPDSPIFVYIGGEGEESCRANQPGLFWYDLAKTYQALLVTVEHRFYGESYPTEGMSTRELRFLSSDQALADLARLVSYLKESLGLQKSPVISFGGSYPGNLAAWFRLKYPSVTHGSVASSAPINAKTNFVEYMEVVGDSLKYFSGDTCYAAFEDAAQEVARLGSFGVGSKEYAKLAKDFKTCGRISSDNDYNILLSNLMGNVQGTVQYNNEVSYYLNVTDICTTMTSSDPTVGATAYDRFVTLNADFLDMYGQKCDDISWNATIAYLQATAKDPDNNGRPWTYQTCKEFGFYQTTDSLVRTCIYIHTYTHTYIYIYT